VERDLEGDLHEAKPMRGACQARLGRNSDGVMCPADTRPLTALTRTRSRFAYWRLSRTICRRRRIRYALGDTARDYRGVVR
jgi:hypothetical protein